MVLSPAVRALFAEREREIHLSLEFAQTTGLADIAFYRVAGFLVQTTLVKHVTCM